MLNKILKLVKVVLFVSMLVLSYFVTERVVDYVSTLDIVLIKRVVNIILITIVTGIYFKTSDKNEIKKPSKHSDRA